MGYAAPNLVNADGTILPLAQIEAMAISYALQTCRGASEAARKLGIGRSTLYRKMDELPALLATAKSFCEPKHVEPILELAERPKTVKALVRSMESESLETIQWAVEVHFSQRKTLGEIAELLFK